MRRETSNRRSWQVGECVQEGRRPWCPKHMNTRGTHSYSQTHTDTHIHTHQGCAAHTRHPVTCSARPAARACSRCAPSPTRAAAPQGQPPRRLRRQVPAHRWLQPRPQRRMWWWWAACMGVHGARMQQHSHVRDLPRVQLRRLLLAHSGSHEKYAEQWARRACAQGRRACAMWRRAESEWGQFRPPGLKLLPSSWVDDPATAHLINFPHSEKDHRLARL
jgi:hypothetical protein